MEMLRTGDMRGLAALTGAHPSVLRHLSARLWDADTDVRQNAVEALATTAVQHPDRGLELLRRFAWALNDESGTNGNAVLPAMAAVISAVPELGAPFVGIVVEAISDPGLAETARRAIERIGSDRPELLAPSLQGAGASGGTDGVVRRVEYEEERWSEN